MESSLKFLTIQIHATCWLVFLLIHKLYYQRGLENTIDHRKTDLSIPIYRMKLDSSKCSDIVCIEGRSLVLAPPLFRSCFILLLSF
jgi:hypothetical protein